MKLIKENEKRYYLEKYDRVYSTGCFLRWDGKNLIFDGYDDDTYFDGDYMEWDSEIERPYIILQSDVK